MLSAYANSVKIPELRNRILFTLGIIALTRLAANIPCPGVDAAKLQEVFDTVRDTAGAGGLLGMFDLFSGGALEQFAVAALGIMPYITASIVMQLLMPVIPALEKLRHEGEAGHQKVNQYTRYLTLVICVVHGTAAVRIMANPGMIFRAVGDVQLVADPGLGFTISTVIFLTAGTMALVWFGEQITDRGIGNGISLIITVNIISRLPSAMFGLISLVRGGPEAGGNIIHVLLLLVMFFLVCAATVALTQAVRKIPIKHARRSTGRGYSGGQTSYLPLRVNYSGVMPIIFGSAIMMFPPMIMRLVGPLQRYQWIFQYGEYPYMIMFGTVIVLFSYFWVATQFNPIQIADNLQKQSGYVPGIRPGQPTARFLDATMTRITFVGALALTAIAILPMIMSSEFNIPQSVAAFFGGTSLLILVGVLLDTMRQVEAYLLSHHYDGFLGKGRLRSRRGATGGV